MAQIGDVVAWQDTDAGDQVRVYGVIRELDGNPPDAAHVMQIGAWHHAWGHSTNHRGYRHSLALSDVTPASSKEKGIVASVLLSEARKDKAEATYERR